MHRTDAGEKRKALKKEAGEIVKESKAVMRAARTIPEAHKEAQRLQEKADNILAESQVLKLHAKLEDLQVWEMEKEKTTKKGTKTYTYWMASWREGDKVRNIHLGSSRKMDAEAARQKARMLKAEALGISHQ